MMAGLVILGLPSCSKDEPGYEPEPFVPETAPELIYPAPENKEFIRMAYFPSYRNVGVSVVPDFIYESVDIAYYAFASINKDYTVDLQEPYVLQTLVQRAHSMGKKVVLSFNGDSSTYTAMTGSAKTREKFIKSLMLIMNQFNLDGIDNDWEFPSAANGSALGNLYLMRELSNVLHAPGENKLLTMAVTPGKYAGAYRDAIVRDLYDCVDWFCVMTYDDFSTSVPGIHHSPVSLVETAYDYYIKQKSLPPSKFITGIPCYGRPSGMSQSGRVLTYATILSKGGSPDEDTAEITATTGEKYTIYYNGRKTVEEKVEFCVEHGLGGYFFWEQGQDSYDERSLLLCASNKYHYLCKQ